MVADGRRAEWGRNPGQLRVGYQGRTQTDPSAWRWMNRPVGGLLGTVAAAVPQAGRVRISGRCWQATDLPPHSSSEMYGASRHRYVEDSFSQREDQRKYNSQSSVTEIGGIFHGAT